MELFLLFAPWPPVFLVVYAVGGAGPENFNQWIKASADGFGIGSALFKPGMAISEVADLAARIVAAYDEAAG